jgi:hypothetical protein
MNHRLNSAAFVSFASLAALAACSSSSTSGAPTGSSSSSGGASSSSGSGSSRMTISCDDAFTNTAAVMNNTVEKGTWGNIPSDLQHTPSGATLCGSLGDMPDGATATKITIVLSDLSDADLYTFYNPYVMSLGCTMDPPDSSSPLIFDCGSGHGGTINADSQYQFFAISYF